MEEHERNALHDLLGELFPAGEKQDLEAEKEEGVRVLELAHPHGGKPIQLKISDQEMEAALKKGVEGLQEFIRRKVKEAADQAGIPLLEVVVHDTGLDLSKAGATLKLEVWEAIELYRTLGHIIQEKKAQADIIGTLRRNLGL